MRPLRPLPGIAFVIALSPNPLCALGPICADTFEFSAPLFVPLGGATAGVGTGDFDGDGDNDIVAALYSNQLTLVENTGPGTFSPGATISVATEFSGIVGDCFVGDLDGDGDPDVALLSAPFTPFAGQSNRVIIVGNDAGTLVVAGSYQVGTAPVRLAGRDLDGDLDIDLVATNFADDNLTILLNNGAATDFTAQTLAACDSPNPVSLADMNGDGRNDIVVGCFGSEQVGIFLNNGAGGFVPTSFPADEPRGVAALDFDRDGLMDVAVTNEFHDTVSVHFRYPGAGFSAPSPLPTGRFPGLILAGPIDLSGDQAILAFNAREESISVWTLKGVLFGVPGLLGTPGEEVAYAALANVDADPRNDIVYSAPNAEGVVVLFNKSKTIRELIDLILAEAGALATDPYGPSFGMIGIVDYNGDGVIDNGDVLRSLFGCD